MNTFGKAVAARRGNKSYRQVATEIGIDHSLVARVEHGGMPSVPTLAKLVRWLGMPADQAIAMLGA